MCICSCSSVQIKNLEIIKVKIEIDDLILNAIMGSQGLPNFFNP